MTGTLDAVLAGTLLLCASLYFGTGWSLVLFSFPLAPRLTPQNYALPMVEPVKHATRTFTVVTVVMLVGGVWLLVRAGEDRWVPGVYLAGLAAATAVTMLGLFPYNREMRAGIVDADRLQWVLTRWMRLNRVRVALWTVQWSVLVLWFVLEAA